MIDYSDLNKLYRIKDRVDGYVVVDVDGEETMIREARLELVLQLRNMKPRMSKIAMIQLLENIENYANEKMRDYSEDMGIERDLNT